MRRRRRRDAAPPRRPRRGRMRVYASRDGVRATQESEKPIEDARVLARRREEALAQELRRAAEQERLARRVPSPPPGRPPENRRPQRRVEARVHPTTTTPLCVQRERQQRRMNQAQASEPDTRRNLDKRTARLRNARHFAAAIASHREHYCCPSPHDKENSESDFGAGARVVVRVRPLLPHLSLIHISEPTRPY